MTADLLCLMVWMSGCWCV